MAQAHRKAKTAAVAAMAGMATRAELPFATLCGLALLAPFAVLAQGGDWPLALLSAPAVLAAPGAGLEMMLGLARAALWMEGGTR